MIFLVDNQLPAALARFLEAKGHQAHHVMDLGLDEADDEVLWEHAAQHGMVLISKDEDFLALSSHRKEPVQWLWVRLGNCRKRALLAAFEAALPEILAALQRGDRIIELR